MIDEIINNAFVIIPILCAMISGALLAIAAFCYKPTNTEKKQNG